MTKSQNTKNEQQKYLCITSEQLTEQWKKGELPVDKDYYIKLKCGFILIDYYCQLYDNCHFPIDIGFDSIPEDDIAEVLAPVPSYEELQNMNKAVNECMAANIKLVEQNAQLKEQINHLLKTQARQFVDNQKLQVKAEKAKDVVNIDTARQIKQLKELLKECSIANTALVSIMDWLRKATIPEQRENCVKLFEKTQELQKQLDEALR